MNPIETFKIEKENRIKSYHDDRHFLKLSQNWLIESFKKKYEYNFTWLGRPIIQYPFDIISIQELIWKVKPDLIIETGIAHGGSIIFSASMLEIIGKGEVLGIDIDIRQHNKIEIQKHPMYKRITMIEGSSVDKVVFQKVKKIVNDHKIVLLLLDSNHTHDHVLHELQLYSQFVSLNSYIVVFDTFIEDLPDELSQDRPWGKGNNPKTAVKEFLKDNQKFQIDKKIESKLIITSSPDGFLRRVK